MRDLIRNQLRRRGFDVNRYGLLSIIESLEVSCILDVGANVGQFANGVITGGYRGKIVSFEPTKAAHKKLTKNSERDQRWVVHPMCAVGNTNDAVSINISENSVSSSILGMEKEHELNAPSSRYVGQETVPMIRLDDVFPDYVQKSDIAFLKIDVQGYEKEVLAGADGSLHRIKAVKLELSTVELYSGEGLFHCYLDYFAERDFELWDVEPGFRHLKSGRLLQFDAVFVNQTDSPV